MILDGYEDLSRVAVDHFLGHFRPVVLKENVQLLREVPEQIDVPLSRCLHAVFRSNLVRRLEPAEDEAPEDRVEDHEDRQADGRQQKRHQTLPEGDAIPPTLAPSFRSGLGRFPLGLGRLDIRRRLRDQLYRSV